MDEKQEIKSQENDIAKKTYSKPTLIIYGDVRDLTLGPTPGLNESGNPETLKG